MLLYGLKCRKNAESKNIKAARPKNGRIMLLSKYAVWDSKKSEFPKGEEAKGLLSSLGLKAPSTQILLLGPLLF